MAGVASAPNSPNYTNPGDWNPRSDFRNNAFVYQRQSAPISGQTNGLVMRGSTSGVPQKTTDSVGEFTSQHTAATMAYGIQTALQDPLHQPVFWAVVLTVIGTLGLAHTAWWQVRDLGRVGSGGGGG